MFNRVIILIKCKGINMENIQVFPATLPEDMKDKSSIIRLMSEAGQINLNSVDGFVDDVMNHENEMETDVLPQVALPHAKSESVNTPFIVVAKSTNGIIWNHDNKVKLIIMIAAGKNAAKEHLTIIAKLASNLADDDFIDELINSDINEIANKIRGLYE